MLYGEVKNLDALCSTMLEANDYLCRNQGGETENELRENGQELLTLMENILQENWADIRDCTLLEKLETLRRLWPGRDDRGKIGSLLQEWRAGLKTGLSYTVRAVFFAELGSKWDAMESVYAFMRQDPRFDPVVVLTPVIRKHPDENEEMQIRVIYEDFLTELGISFLHAQEYDPEKVKPDLAFLSQPYEDCSLPMFTAAAIAQYTRLVYLPYYIPALLVEEEREVLCCMQSFCWAWKTCGANERHRDFYQKYHPLGGQNMLLTGLPKLDHVVHLRSQGVPLPEKWEKLRGKRIFLWNSWFKPGESSLRFLIEIIDWFEAHPDCALIWRPHPMTGTVLRLYYPEKIQKGVNGGVRRINDADNMVLDSGPSYDAALYYADAMISDNSSMMILALMLDKPVFNYQNVPEECIGGDFVRPDWMESGDCWEDIRQFLENFSADRDEKASLREKIRREDLALHDGSCGSRLCQELWTQLHQEDFGESGAT